MSKVGRAYKPIKDLKLGTALDVNDDTLFTVNNPATSEDINLTRDQIAEALAITKNGVADYNDTSTTAAPVTLVADTWTTIPNNGAGAFTNLAYLPSGVTSLMNTGTGALDLSQLSLGDNVIIRNDYNITPNTNNSLLEFRYTLGSGGGAYTLEKIVGRLDSGSGLAYRYSLTTDMIYMGDANTKDNPVVLQVKLSTSGTLVNAGTSLGVTRR